MPALRVAKNIRNTLSSILILTMVAACGGSGPAGAPVAGSPNIGGGSDTSPTNENVITLSWEDGSTENSIEDIMPRTLNISLQNDAGAAVVNEIVEVTTSLGTLFPSSGRVATNSAGVASIQVDVTGAENGEAGAINVIQTDPNNGVSVSARLTISAISSATSVEDANVVSLAWADGSASNIISDTASRTLQITLTDSQGSPLDGELLSVVTTLGLLSPSSGSIATNSAGIATIDIDITGAENNEAGLLFVTHTDTVSQQQVEKNLTITASVTGSGASNSISVALWDDNFVVVDTSPENVTVNLKDSEGNNLANKVVTVSTTLGKLSPSSGVVTTDETGNAVVQLDVSGAEDKEGGTLVARHTDSDGDTVSANVNFSASITQAGDANVLSISLGDADYTIMDTSPENVTVNLKDSGGNNLPNELITFTSTLGSISPSSGIVVTDDNGNAVVQLNVSGAEDGEGGSLSVSHSNDNGDIVRKTIYFTASITPQNTTSGYRLESAFFAVSILDETVNGAADSLLDQSGTLAALALARPSEQGGTVNAVQNSIYAVRLTNANGDAVEGAIIKLATSVGGITPASGQVLTNVNGIAYVTLDSGSSDPGAAGTVTGTVSDATISSNFAIGSVTLEIGYYDTVTSTFNPGVIGVNEFVDGSVTLSPSGTASLQVGVVDENGNLFTSPVTLSFESNCSISGLAKIDTNVSTVGGIATATYEALGCSSTDAISASVIELSNVNASGTIQVNDAAPNAIQFVSATPVNISLKGTGGAGRQEFSTVVFKVIDEAGLALPNASVEILLSSSLGGISLAGDSSGNGLLEADGEALSTNADGEVSVRVNAGAVSTSVRLIANVAGQDITAVSDLLTITTGLPDSNSMSLSANILATGGNDFDGVLEGDAVSINIRAADAFNNPVPEGTAVYFTTEYGKIEDFCTMPAIDSEPGSDLTESGVCSVVWTPQNPRANDYAYELYTGEVGLVTGNVALDGSDCLDSVNGVPCPSRIGSIYGGHSMILAYALGEESFVDSNGDGLFNYQSDGVTPEIFDDLPEAFIDHNGDGVFGNEGTSGACNSALDDVDPLQVGECANWQPGGEFEEFVDSNSNGVYDWGNGKYNGSLCSQPSSDNGDCETQLVYVSATMELNAGGSQPIIGIYDETDTYVGATAITLATSTDTAERRFYVSDQFNGRLPEGTTVSIESDNCKLSGLTSFIVTDTSAKGNHYYSAFMSEDTETEVKTGFITITVTVPARAGGNVATSQFACNDDQ